MSRFGQLAHLRSRGYAIARLVLSVASVLLVAACGPVSRRDFADMDQRKIVFDDMCSLQSFFDARGSQRAVVSQVRNEQSIETERNEPDEEGNYHRVLKGEGTYVIRSRAARAELFEILKREYDQLPDLSVTSEQEVSLRVGYWATGQMRHLRPDRVIELNLGDRTLIFPYNACVGQLLFGSRFYAMRREFLDNEAARARGEVPPSEQRLLQEDQARMADGGLPTVSTQTTSVANADAGVTADR